jgi:lysophospholipase L1-like esterase
VLLGELGARVVYFVAKGLNPYYLVYGFTDALIDRENGHTASFDGYFKFPPSREITQYGRLESTPIRINNLGFRGPDFAPQKPPGALRVVAMGGSSTFGFYDRDPFTYPMLLAAALERALGRPVEVLNAGIPHANTDNILAMLEGEITGYQPDVVTIYSGYNDAGEVIDATPIESFNRWLHGHSAGYMAFKAALTKTVGSIAGLTSAWGDRGWARHLQCADATYIERQQALQSARYRRNLNAFVDRVRSVGATPVFIRQPVTARFGFVQDQAPEVADVTYEGEVAQIFARLTNHECVTPLEALVLIHHELIGELDRIAAEREVTLVDNIATVDAHPGSFASQVHLVEDANQNLANALANALVPLLERRVSGSNPAADLSIR